MDEINKTSHENITHLAANTLYFLQKGKKLLVYLTSNNAIDGTDNHESPIRVTHSLSPAVYQVIHGVNFILKLFVIGHVSRLQGE